MEPKRGVCFTCDNNPQIVFQLLTCIESIRRHGCDDPIFAVVVGEVNAETRDRFEQDNVTLIKRQWTDYPRFVRNAPAFLKWFLPVEQLDVDELLYLDTDTFAFAPLAQLFESLGPEDFHARCSHQAFETDELTMLGPFLVKPPGRRPDYQRMYRSIRQHCGLEYVLGPNTGIMLFRNRTHERVMQRPELVRCVRNLLCYGLLPYPLPYPHLMDEFVGRLCIGMVGGVSNAAIPPELSPFYVDSYGTLGAQPAVVIHTFFGFYGHFLFNRFGRETCQQYLDLSGKQAADAPGRRMGVALRYGRYAWLWLNCICRLTQVAVPWRCALGRRLIRSRTGLELTPTCDVGTSQP